MPVIPEVAEEAVLAAANHLVVNFETQTSTGAEENRAFMSRLSRASERIMMDIISRAFPRHAIHGQEHGLSGTSDEFLWVLNPLDGPYNYLKGLPLFAVSVGVIARGSFHAGAIVLPLLDRVYVAERGCGATRNGEPIHTSDTADLASSSLAFDSGFRNFDETRFAALRAVAPAAFSARMHGCSVGNLAFLADGGLDVVIEFDDHPWDYAAGVCILREAGGRVTAVDGSEFAYGGRSYVATNGVVHDTILERIGQACAAVA